MTDDETNDAKAIGEASVQITEIIPQKSKRGGVRANSGRPKKPPNASTITQLAIDSKRRLKLMANELDQTPMDYLIEIMRDNTNTQKIRMECAVHLLPYMHPKLIAQTVNINQQPTDITRMGLPQLEQLVQSCDAILGVSPAPALQGPALEAVIETGSAECEDDVQLAPAATNDDEGDDDE